MNWEYLVAAGEWIGPEDGARCSDHGYPSPLSQSSLDDLGRDGWDLVSASWAGPELLAAVFRRPRSRSEKQCLPIVNPYPYGSGEAVAWMGGWCDGVTHAGTGEESKA